MKSLLSFVAASALLASAVSAASQCSQGNGPDANGDCVPCPAGYYNSQSQGTCQPAQAGWYACGPSSTCVGATAQTQCGAGSYSSGQANSQCTTCPAGAICPSATTTQPQLCSPGQYQSTTGSGATECPPCPVGTYNNENGATACCNCCAGTYNDQVHQTHCYYCGEHTANADLYSPVGATSVNQCQAQPISGVTNAPKGTCDVTPASTDAGDGQCPAEQGTAPSQGVQSKRRRLECGTGFKRCPLYTGIGGYDCVDVRNDPEQCGGCLAIDGAPTSTAGQDGQDCTAIPHVSVVNCVQSKCVIQTCRKGFSKSIDGKSCQSVGGLMLQPNESSKRSTHGRRWHVPHSEN